jgi:hypothetical protein
MADPEIELPMTTAQLRFSNSAPGISNDSTTPEKEFCQNSTDPASRATSIFLDDKFNEKSGQNEPSEDEQQGAGAVVYHYLTFATELPNPTSIYPVKEGQNAPPEPPVLNSYECPFDWPEKRKNMTIGVACIITMLTAFTAGAYTPGLGQMTAEWHVSNVAALVGITTFTTGECPYFRCLFGHLVGTLSLISDRFCDCTYGTCAFLRNQWQTTRVHRFGYPFRSMPIMYGSHPVLRWHVGRPLLRGRGGVDLFYYGYVSIRSQYTVTNGS